MNLILNVEIINKLTFINRYIAFIFREKQNWFSDVFAISTLARYYLWQQNNKISSLLASTKLRGNFFSDPARI